MGGDEIEARTDAFVESGELRLNIPVVEPLIGKIEVGSSYVADRVGDCEHLREQVIYLSFRSKPIGADFLDRPAGSPGQEWPVSP